MLPECCPMKKKLTARGISALKPAAPGARYDIWDTEVPNFGVRVTDAGKVAAASTYNKAPAGGGLNLGSAFKGGTSGTIISRRV